MTAVIQICRLTNRTSNGSIGEKHYRILRGIVQKLLE